MIYLGDFSEDATVRIPFNTFSSDDPSASVTITDLAAGDVHVHKDGNTTQATTSGATVSIDFDTITGNHLVTIDTSADAFYATGSDYHVRIEGTTVDGATINAWIGCFSIQNRYNTVNVGSINAGAITATSIASNAITSAKIAASAIGATQIATGAFTAAKFAANAITSTVIADNAITAAKIATGAFTSAKFAASAITSTVIADNAITAAKIATDAISAAKVAADAVVKIAAGVWDRVLSAANHNISNSAGRRLRQLQDNGVYEDGAVWVDEASGTSTGTVDFEDATVFNRANDFDNAQTVAASVGLSRINVNNGNSITLTATINNFNIGIQDGNWSLALGGQDIGNCDIYAAEVSGIGTGTNPHFHGCEMGAVTLPPCQLYNSGIGNGGGTFTVGSAGAFRFVDCYSDVAGASSPVIDMGAAVGATTMEFRRWSGGLTLNNMGTGDVVSVDVVSGGTITVNGTGGEVNIRGLCLVVDGSSGAVTINQKQALNTDKINAEMDTALSDIHLDHLFATAYDATAKPGAADALLNELVEDDAGVTRYTANALEQGPSGGGGTPPQLLQSTTIATLASQTSFTLTAGSADDDAYNGATVVVTDQSTATQKAVGRVSDYTGSTLTVTLESDPAIFTMAVGDTVDLIAESPRLADLSTFDAATDTVDVGAIDGSVEAAEDLAASARTIVRAAAVAGTLSTTQMSTNLTETTDNHYNGRNIYWTSGALTDQATDITGYDGTSKVLSFTQTTEAPSDGDTFNIV